MADADDVLAKVEEALKARFQCGYEEFLVEMELAFENLVDLDVCNLDCSGPSDFVEKFTKLLDDTSPGILEKLRARLSR